MVFEWNSTCLNKILNKLFEWDIFIVIGSVIGSPLSLYTYIRMFIVFQSRDTDISKCDADICMRLAISMFRIGINRRQQKSWGEHFRKNSGRRVRFSVEGGFLQPIGFRRAFGSLYNKCTHNWTAIVPSLTEETDTRTKIKQVYQKINLMQKISDSPVV